MREGIELTTHDVTDAGPRVVRLGEPGARAAFLPVEVAEGDAAPRAAFLRMQPLAGVAEAEAWEREHRWLRRTLAPLAASLRPLTGLDGGAPEPSVFPPVYYCRETRGWIGAVCPECDGAGDGPDRCPQCGTRRPAGAGPPAPATPLERVARRAGERGKKPAGTKGGKRRSWLPCAACPHLAECFPAEGPSDLARKRLASVSEVPAGAILVEPFDLPLRAWLRLASGERWSGVRASLADWPASHLARLDAALGHSRPTLLGPETGPPFALETLLLRLDFLRQTLEGLRALAHGPGQPHLGLAPDAIAVGLGSPGVMSPLLWTTRVRYLDVSRARVDAGGEAVPPPDRPPSLVPPECQASASTPGRCHPRGGPPDFSAGKPWDFHFLPQHPNADAPSKGTRIRFAADDGSGRPTGPAVEGHVSFGFRDVWTVAVDEPGRFEPALREILARDEGRPLVVVRPVLDHALADDLYAAGTLWLASLLVDPGALELAAQLRDRLREAGTADPPRYLEAVRNVGFLWYQSAGGAPERRLPEDVLETALEIGNRLCGGVPGDWPGQGHQPAEPETRAAALAGLTREVEGFARAVRYRLFGFSPEDADVRAVLEGLAGTG